MHEKRGKVAAKDVRTLTQIVMEHNRTPGVFDYNYGQNFYSHHEDIDQEAYLVIGDRKSKYAHETYGDGVIHSPENKPY